MNDLLFFSVYFAPKSIFDMLDLGKKLSHIHLRPTDKLIGIIGDRGAGKSTITKGMFPGVELMDEADGYDPAVIEGLEISKSLFYNKQTYHVAVTNLLTPDQLEELAQAVFNLLDNEKRVIIVDFDRLYPYLKLNAELMIGIGGEVLVTRPTVFGPDPADMAENVYKTLKYRRMAYGAQKLTHYALVHLLGVKKEFILGDIKQGFMMEFDDPLEFEIAELEKAVMQLITANVDIPKDEANEDMKLWCTKAGDIENFTIVHEKHQDPMTKRYLLIGHVGEEPVSSAKYFNSIVSK